MWLDDEPIDPIFERILRAMWFFWKKSDEIFNEFNSLSFDDFFKKYCKYEKHKQIILRSIWNTISQKTLNEIIDIDEYIYKCISKIIFYGVKNWEIETGVLNNLNLLDKDWIAWKIDKIVTQFFVNPEWKDLINVSWENFDVFKWSIHEILLKHFTDYYNKIVDPNFFRFDIIVDQICWHLISNYNIENINVWSSEDDIDDRAINFFDFCTNDISNNIKFELDNSNGDFDFYIALIAIILYNNLSESEITKCLLNFSKQTLNQSAKKIPKDYDENWLCKQANMIFFTEFQKDISIELDDFDLSFKSSKPWNNKYVSFLKYISRGIKSWKIWQARMALGKSIWYNSSNIIINKIEEFCSDERSEVLSSWASFCSWKISDSIFSKNSAVFDFPDFDSEFTELLQWYPDIKDKYHIKKNTFDVIRDKFISDEKKLILSQVNEFIKNNEYFLENIKIEDLFLFYKFYKYIFENDVKNLNEKYKDFVINYFKKEFELKSKSWQSSNNTKPSKPQKKSVLPTITRDNESNFMIKNKELDPLLIEAINTYFKEVDPESEPYKKSIFEELWKINLKWKLYRKKYFEKWPLKKQFFEILNEFKYQVRETIDLKSYSNSPVSSPDDAAFTNNEGDASPSIFDELFLRVDKSETDEEKICAYVEILKKLWYEFYTNPEDNNQNNGNKEDDFKKDFLEKSLSDPTLLNKFWSMLKKLVYWDGHLRKIVDKKFNWYPIFALNITWSLRLIFLIWDWKRFIYDIMNHDDYETFLYKTAR